MEAQTGHACLPFSSGLPEPPLRSRGPELHVDGITDCLRLCLASFTQYDFGNQQFIPLYYRVVVYGMEIHLTNQVSVYLFILIDL